MTNCMKTLMLLTTLLAGCCGMAAPATEIVGENTAAITVREADGHTTTLRKHPKRVVICYGSFTGVWYAAGGTAAGVPDVTVKETLPEAARQLPTVGNFANPNPERLLALRPDLVLLAGNMGSHRQLREILERERIDSLMVTYENYHDFVRLLDLFARLNGTAGDSRSKAARLTAEVDTVVAGVPKNGGPRFLCLFASLREVSAETSLSHAACVATMLGGKNAIALPDGRSSLRVKLNMERIILTDPDLILVVTMGKAETVKRKLQQEMMAGEAWKNLQAVKNGRVYFLPNELFLYRPNERFPEAFRLMKELLYGAEVKR